jgi:uncharacterized protein YrzB (UPF0473 family)
MSKGSVKETRLYIMRRMLIICFVIVLSTTLFGCAKSKQNKLALLNVKPFELFSGDAKKFQPFLGAMSGAIKLKYKGNKRYIKTSIEIWENGTKKETLNSFGGSIIQMSKSGDHIFDGEFVISVKKQNDTANANKTRYAVTSAFIDQNGSSSFEMQIEADNQLTASMPIVLNNKGQDISENEDIAVWGLQASDQNSMQTVDLTPEMLKRVRWAMIVKISLVDE